MTSRKIKSLHSTLKCDTLHVNSTGVFQGINHIILTVRKGVRHNSIIRYISTVSNESLVALD